MQHKKVEGKVSAAGLSGLAAAVLLFASAGFAATVSFQDGVNGYAGTSDTWIGGASPANDNAASTLVEWDGDDGGGQNYGLLRFNNIFGSGPGQIPAGASISSATLTYQVTNPGGSATVNQVVVDWAPPDPVTWNNFGGEAGVQTDEYGAQVGTAAGGTGTQNLNVTASLAAWSVNPSLNKGWVFRPTGGTDGVEFVSSNSGTVASRPKLTVSYTLMTVVDLGPDSISTVVGKANVPMAVSIPPGSNNSNPVNVTLTTSNAAVAVPVGASGNTLVVTFAVGAPIQQTVPIDIGQAGSATISSSNDAGLDNDTVPVTVTAGTVSIAPVSVSSGAGTSVPVKLSISSGSNETRAVSVTVTTGNASVAELAGATGGSLAVNFTAGGAASQWVNLQCGQVGSTTLTTSNDSGLSGVSLPVQVFAGFNFTATSDPRTNVTLWNATLSGIQDRITTLGVFHASAGDIDPPQPLRDAIDARFGPTVTWFPLIGNHEEETAADMTWLRAEYQNGNGQRTALKYATNQDGPLGTVETTFSWDYGNAHFISLNQYWNGGTAAGSDVAADGDVVTALYDWLAADLAANTRPVVIVFGHEPAYPFHRHVGDSLDKYPANRDAFWSLLHQYGVQAYICGHTHFYTRYQTTPEGTWQIDLGNAGNDPGDGQTFANVIVTPTQVTYDIWRNHTGSWVKQESWSALIGARLIVGPTLVNRTVRVGLMLPNDTFTVGATGSGPVSYTISVDGNPSWLSVYPTSGTYNGTPNVHEIVYSTSGLAINEYEAAIRVASVDAVNSPQLIDVNLVVRSAVADFDADNDVDQSDFGRLQACLAGTGAGPIPPECVPTDLDGDGSVDPGDITVFISCFAGPDQPIPLSCP
jgi:hypothetical protein